MKVEEPSKSKVDEVVDGVCDLIIYVGIGAFVLIVIVTIWSYVLLLY